MAARYSAKSPIADDWELDHGAFIELVTGAVAFGAIDVSDTPAGEGARFPLVMCLLADVGENREEFESNILH